jgi:hypothetical protein
MRGSPFVKRVAPHVALLMRATTSSETRAMAYMHPALAEHLRKRWMRPDAYRFAAPGTPEAKPPGTLHPWAEVARQEQAAADEARARRSRAGCVRA